MKENEDGSVTFLGEDGHPLPLPRGSSGLVHERANKKPKTILQVPDSGLRVGTVDPALRNFDRVFGVDTNRYTLGVETVHITTACELLDRRFESPEWHATHSPQLGFEFREPRYNAELIGWYVALQHGAREGWFHGTSNALVLVDAHLNDLDAFNSRTKPIILDYHLPEGVSLGYASADRSDHMANKLLAFCDKLGRDVFRAIRERSDLRTLRRDGGPLFAEHRWFGFQGP